jgi:hypothetical protein
MTLFVKMAKSKLEASIYDPMSVKRDARLIRLLIRLLILRNCAATVPHSAMPLQYKFTLEKKLKQGGVVF